MASYAGTMSKGRNTWVIGVCWTGRTAKSMMPALGILGIVAGGVIGAALGFMVSLPEPVSKVLGTVAGAIVGVLIGGLYTLYQLYKGICQCPPGAFGFCICITLFRPVPFAILGMNIWLPSPRPPRGCPTACPVVVPPGCP